VSFPICKGEEKCISTEIKVMEKRELQEFIEQGEAFFAVWVT